ncbi:family 1 glycosylhydrolase [Gordonia polyisoprenivorans]|uniref:family 1 glycosylhydrolase n=1 Tax=Gordonia polyisoprenivorans TaxID=84595 RepID=UPI002300C500|nr:family 1 glycosylhydrolase [Gordonia polyisoprenivorans]WCB36530.1 family 1 glycosylhydrolase [Gordonia polyisoprenivorans]
MSRPPHPEAHAAQPSAISRRGLLGATTAVAAGVGLGASGLRAASASAAPGTAPFVHAPRVPGWTDGFHFGAATSGFQAEGFSPDSNWRRYTDRAARTGRVDPVRNSVDFRHRYRSDLHLAAGMGLNTFRFGIEWARVEPQRGRFSAAALAYYDDLVAGIRSLGMSPMITLVHYVYPGWVADQGGFLGPRTLGDFERYARMITARYAEQCSMWISINEPLVFYGHEKEIGALTDADMPRFLDRVAQAHRIAHAAAHDANPQARVAVNEAFLPAVTPVTDALFMNRVLDTLDFIGIDYYYGAALNNLTTIAAAGGDFAAVRPQPDDIYQACHHYAQAFPGTPLYIVENGMPLSDGTPRADGYTRADFLRDSLFWLQRARGDGLPIVGYNHWSITDNYEWGSYTPRFGLYRVDVLRDPGLTRHPTSGVDAYRELTAGAGPAANYRPVMAPAVGSFARIPQSWTMPSRVDGPRAQL